MRIRQSYLTTVVLTAALLGLTMISATDRWVDAKGGLKVRQEPNANGKVITTLKDGTSVSVLEEIGDPVTISGATGKWTKISSGKVTGWAFGGFLSNSIPKALWGTYCKDGEPKCDQAEYSIDGQMVWQSSEGGCGAIEKVERKGNEYHIYCEGVKGVTLKPMAKGKIQLTITGQASVILKKER